jgi:uncharacterized protein (DUF1919 family)
MGFNKLKTLPPDISPNNWFLKIFNSDLSRKEKYELWRKRQVEIERDRPKLKMSPPDIQPENKVLEVLFPNLPRSEQVRLWNKKLEEMTGSIYY